MKRPLYVARTYWEADPMAPRRFRVFKTKKALLAAYLERAKSFLETEFSEPIKATIAGYQAIRIVYRGKDGKQYDRIESCAYAEVQPE